MSFDYLIFADNNTNSDLISRKISSIKSNVYFCH
ncbi:hypothetical protein AB670_02500 [Chryseobacterium sp. MOF25P]|nr:hypothetical protein AB670_02500 [Chryseobacterium sp. MOF25P]OBW43972.1 hypothetical protein AB671_03964 [Chryseobacterium sp. BGARF1]